MNAPKLSEEEIFKLALKIKPVEARETYLKQVCGADKNDEYIASALAYHRQALPLRQELVKEFPNNPIYLAELGSTINNLGLLLARQRKNRAALEMFQQAVEYSEEAYSKQPQTIHWGRWPCISLRNVAFKLKFFDEREQALESFQRAVNIRRRLAFDNPRVPALKGELYKAWLDLGNYQRELERADADRSFQRAAGILENLVRQSDTAQDLFELAIVYAALATPAKGAADSSGEGERAE